MKFAVERGSGRFLVNAIRQMVYTKRYVLRPIAFRVGVSSNVLSAGDTIVEDMIKFSADLSNLHFQYTGVGNQTDKIIRCDCICRGVLCARELQQNGIKIVGSEELDRDLLHAVNGNASGNEFSVTILFRNACGAFTHEQNKYAIANNFSGITEGELDSFVVLTSRHSDVISVTTEITSGIDKDFVEIGVNLYTGEPEEQVVKEACSAMMSLIQQVS